MGPFYNLLIIFSISRRQQVPLPSLIIIKEIVKMSTVKVNCKNCSIEFATEKKYISRGEGKFCSIRCGAIYNGAQKKTNNKTCAWCFKPFYRKPSKAPSKSGLYFCCRKHKDMAQRMEGLEDLQPEHYGTGLSSRSYRYKALERYGHCCNRCHYDKNLDVLEVHHKDRDRANNHISNLEVLCKNCHHEEHAEEKRLRIQKRLVSKNFNFKIDWPPLEQLKDMVNSSSYADTAKKLGVSDTAVKLHIKRRDPHFKKGS